MNPAVIHIADYFDPCQAAAAYDDYVNTLGITMREFYAVAANDPEFCIEVIDAFIMRRAGFSGPYPKFPDLMC